MKRRLMGSRLVRIVAALLVVAAIVAANQQGQPVASAAGASVVISQVYGGGGNSSAVFNNDFVELVNRSAAPVSVSGWSVQYTSATGTGNFASNVTALPAITLQPGQYLLVQEAPGTTSMPGPLPTPDASGTINMSGTAGKVVLVNSATGLACNGSSTPCSAAQLAQIVDLVGYGNANFSEGAPAPTLTNSTAALRAGAGCVDTDQNSTDFTSGAPTPRNSTTSPNPCGAPSDTPTPTGPTATPTETATPTATPTGATATPTATATATNTPVITTRIRDIQGMQHISPLNGQPVSNVPGIVTALDSNGFFFQDPGPDADDRTSEGLFVFTSSAPTVHVGDAVLVGGTVQEFRPGGAATNLTSTEIGGPSVAIQSSGNPTPTPIVLGAGGRAIPNRIISDDAAGGNVENAGTTFDPANDGIDFYESLEGMLVQVNQAVVVGPTNSFGEIFVLADNGAGATSRTNRGGSLINPSTSPRDFNPERIQIDPAIVSGAPSVNVGDRFNGSIMGVVGYDFGNFQVENIAPLPPVVAGGLAREATSLAPDTDKLTVATFNVENLAPSDGATKFNNLASRIVNNLKSPDIISVEEIQDNSGATDNGVVSATNTISMLISAIQSAGGPTYDYREIDPVNDQDGGQPGGNIRVVLFFNPARVSFVDRPGAGSTTANTVVNNGGVPQLQYSPGRIDPTNAAWTSSRKPLAGEFTFNGRTVFVIGNHFNSKGGDDPLFGPDQPPVLSSETQRNQQATVEKGFIQDILAIDPNALIVVAGDLNDFEFSNPVGILKSAPLSDLIETLPTNERYSYVFEGNSQTLDHILASSAAATMLDGFDVVHINAEFAVQDSDHDPSVARFSLAAIPTPTPTSSATPTATVTSTATETPTPTATSTSAPADTPTTTSTATATATNTAAATATATATATVTRTVTPTSTATATVTPTPGPAGSISLLLKHAPIGSQGFHYDPPGPTPELVQQWLGGPVGCEGFEQNPNLMVVAATSANGQTARVCEHNLRLGVERGPWPGPLDSFTVNVNEKVSFALGSDSHLTGSTIRSATVEVEGVRQASIQVTAYNGGTQVGTQIVSLSSLSPEGRGVKGDNYRLNVDFGQPFTRLELQTTAGWFSVVGGADQTSPTQFVLVH